MFTLHQNRVQHGATVGVQGARLGVQGWGIRLSGLSLGVKRAEGARGVRRLRGGEVWREESEQRKLQKVEGRGLEVGMVLTGEVWVWGGEGGGGMMTHTQQPRFGCAAVLLLLTGKELCDGVHAPRVSGHHCVGP